MNNKNDDPSNFVASLVFAAHACVVILTFIIIFSGIGCVLSALGELF